MDNNKLNNYILTYVNSVNYEGAIMLTAEWGAGKSYYLQNELIPFLDNNNVRAIVVSLHGLKSSFEISKAIYVEHLLLKDKNKIVKNKIFKTRKRKTVVEHSKLAAKTIVRGVSSFFNVDLSCSEEELKKVYDSIDLSNMLLVFEDVERSNMPVQELLAYVNNLVEYDRVKVILITNEAELMIKDVDKYKRIKEKTIGDTIVFAGDPIKAIDSMVQRFDIKKTKDFLAKANKNSFLSKLIVDEIKLPINLRSILFGLEKFDEMISRIKKDIDFEFEKNVLVSTLIFVHKYRKDSSIRWTDKDSTSTKLGSDAYPLHKLVYNYLVSGEINDYEFLKQETEFKEFKALSIEKNELNTKLSVLYSCYIRKEEEVKDIILYLKSMLKAKKVPFELYYKIANYLFYLKPIIGFNDEIDECLNLMIENIADLKESDIEKLVFYGGITLDEDSSFDFVNFKDKVQSIIKKNKMNPLNFSYELNDLDNFCEMANNSKDSYYMNKAFAILINVKKIILLIKKCSAEQINKIRCVFINIYASSNIKDFFENDKDNLVELHSELKKLKKYKGFDSIQKHQIVMMIYNLDEIITKLERGY